jgi:hypothetical protein
VFDTEAIVAQALLSLEAGLLARLAAISGEYNDGLELEYPQDFLPYGSPTEQLTRYPAVEVSDPDTTLSGFPLGQVAAEIVPTIMVAAWLRDPRHVELHQMLRRYGRAIAEVLTAPKAFGSYVVEDVRIAYRSNLETRETARFIGMALAVFQLGSVQYRG